MVGRAYSEFTQHYPRPGWVEHDANEIWEVTLAVVGTALGEADVVARNIAAVGITNQRETIVVWDRETGEPVHNAIVWQDRRDAEFCEELKERATRRCSRTRPGSSSTRTSPATKVRWMLDNVEGLRERAQNGEIAFGTIDSWIVWNLTGGREHITDYSNASRTLMYNIFDLEWDDELLEMLEGPERGAARGQAELLRLRRNRRWPSSAPRSPSLA